MRDDKLTYAVIAAAGSSQRMQGIDKQTWLLRGKPVIAHAVQAFLALPEVEGVVVVCPPGREDLFMRLALSGWWKEEESRLQVVAGGQTRQQSVWRGLAVLPRSTNYVLVHDGARPLVNQDLIRRVLAAAREQGAATAAVPVKDTIKEASPDGQIKRTLPRHQLWAAQTPQGFRYELLYQAHLMARQQGWETTDDAALVEKLGFPVKVVMGDYSNIKLTTPEDLQMLAGVGGVRMGLGYDVHRLVRGCRLVLGGVEIPWRYGLLGHSDADVLVHAVMDALLGASGMGDIGRHFPDTDPGYRGISSLLLLRRVSAMLAEAGFAVLNVDATIVAQAPRLAPYLPAMKENIARELGVAVEAVNVKATTTELIGFTGRGEGIAAYAVATVASPISCLPRGR